MIIREVKEKDVQDIFKLFSEPRLLDRLSFSFFSNFNSALKLNQK
jgi:hypothetical protein